MSSKNVNDIIEHINADINPLTLLEAEEALRLRQEAQLNLKQQQAACAPTKEAIREFTDILEVRQLRVSTSHLDTPKDNTSRPKWLEMLDDNQSGRNPEFQALRDEAQALIQRHEEVPLWFLFEVERKPGVRGPRMAFIARNADNIGLANLAWLNCGWRMLRRWANTDMDRETAIQIDMYLDALAATQQEDEASWGVSIRRNKEWRLISLEALVNDRRTIDDMDPVDDREFDLGDDDEFGL